MRVVGIDSGYVNFAVCGVDSRDLLHPYFWKNEPLFTGPFSEEKLISAVYQWSQKPEIRQLLEEADVIVLERQMAKKFQAVNLCIRFQYFAKTIEVNPNSLGRLFNLPLDRKAKKKAAVDLVSSHVVLPVKKGKKDDLADSFLLALYRQLDDLPDQKEGWIYESGDGTERKRKKPVASDKKPAGGSGRHKKSHRPEVSPFIPSIGDGGGGLQTGGYFFSW